MLEREQAAGGVALRDIQELRAQVRGGVCISKLKQNNETLNWLVLGDIDADLHEQI